MFKMKDSEKKKVQKDNKEVEDDIQPKKWTPGRRNFP